MSIFNRKQTVEIDYDKLAKAIVKAQDKANTENIKNAIIEANKEIENEKIEKNNNEIKKFQKAIGYDENKSNWKNDITTFWKLIVIKQEDVVAEFANTALLKIFISFLYWLLEYALYALCIGFIIVNIVYFPTISIFASIFVSIFSFMIARIIRIARFEVENVNDNNYLFSLMSILTSVFALMVAIITIFINK